jgi:hypothetical protein
MSYGTLQGNFGDLPLNTTVYGCDPRAFCEAFNLSNSCGGVQPNGLDLGITGCCCNQNQCNRPDRPIVPPPTGPTQRQCFTGVGVQSMNYITGDNVVCTGQCGNLSVSVGTNNTVVTMYVCDPFAICQNLNLENRCK